MNVAPSPYISLFSGAAGLDCGIALAFHVRCVCYCESNPGAVERLEARIRDGSIDDAPIWDDVRSFPSRLFAGRVGGVVAGPPCVDYSVAGRRAGAVGKHGQLWDDTAAIIRDVRPGWVALENVAGLLVSHPYPKVAMGPATVSACSMQANR
jgi:DNA (cytosine-5)-methyltransferase 1